MAEPAGKEDQSESMEEILQSIKRIMGDDAAEEAKDADVFELTEVVKDDGSIEKIAEKPASHLVSEPDMDALLDEPEPERMIAPHPRPTPKKLEKEEGLMSSESSNAAANALKQITESAPRDYSIPRIPSPEFRSGNTVEDLVLESLRPMLKEWLDENLPLIVQKIVEKEVKRIVNMYRD